MLTLSRVPLKTMSFVPTVTVDGRTYSIDEFNDMSRLDLSHIRRSVEGQLHDIVAQLEAEELNPTRDEEWLIRATRAKRAFLRALNHIDATIDIRKQEHQQLLLQHFINVCEQELPPATFKRLLKAAHIAANKPTP